MGRGSTPETSRFLTIGPSLGNILRFYGDRDSVAMSVSTDPAKRNPAYVPIPNPDLALRQLSVQYVVWDAYSADRTAFYSERVLRYAHRFGGNVVLSVYVDGGVLHTCPAPLLTEPTPESWSTTSQAAVRSPRSSAGTSGELAPLPPRAVAVACLAAADRRRADGVANPIRPGCPLPAGSAAIDHVVVLIEQNHTFDSYFGNPGGTACRTRLHRCSRTARAGTPSSSTTTNGVRRTSVHRPVPSRWTTGQSQRSAPIGVARWTGC